MYNFPFRHFNWYNKFGTIPSEYREAMSYEEQILWLCEQIRQLKLGSGQYNYDMLENKPQINGVTLQGNLTSEQLGLNLDYNFLDNKPSINGTTLTGNKTLDDLGIQGKLIAGTGIRIIGNTISATGGGGGGGTSDYNDLSNIPTLNGIQIIGDKESYDYKIQPLLEVERSIRDNGKKGYGINIGFYPEGSIIPYKLPETPSANGGYVTFKVFKDDYFDLYGKYDLYKISENHELTTIYTTGNEISHGYFRALSEGEVVINFFDLNTYAPVIKEYLSGEQVAGKQKETADNLEAWDTDLSYFFNANFPYEIVDGSAFTNGYFNLPERDLIIGSELPPYTSSTSHKFTRFDVDDNYSTTWAVIGECLNTSMWFTTKNIGGTEYITSASEQNIVISSLSGEAVQIDLPEEADYIYFQFSNITDIAPNLAYCEIGSVGGGGSSSYTTLTNKPRLNGTEILGNHGLDYYGLNANGGIAVKGGGLLTNTDSRSYKTLTSGSYYDFSNINIGDTLSGIPSTISDANSKRAFYTCYPPTAFNFLGNYEYIAVDFYTGEVLDKAQGNTTNTNIYDHYETNSTIKFFFNFYNTNTIANEFCVVYPSSEFFQDFEQIVRYNEKFTDREVSKDIITGSLYDLTGLTVGDTFDYTNLTTDTNVAYTEYIEALKYLPNHTFLRYKGKGTLIITDLEDKIIALKTFENATLHDEEILDNYKVYFNFTNTDSFTPEVKYNKNFDYKEEYPFWTRLNQNLTFNQDGTTTPQLKTGYYLIPLGNTISYYDSNGNMTQDLNFINSICYYNATTQTFLRTPVTIYETNNLQYELMYNTLSNYWNIYSDESYNYVPKTSIASAFSNTSTNNQVAGAKAVYDTINSLTETITLQYIDYDGNGKSINTTHVTLATKEVTITGGLYLIATQPIILKANTSSYQVRFDLLSDSTVTNIYNVAKFTDVGSGSSTEGNINIISLITLPEGTQTLTLEAYTNNSSKTITIPSYASFDMYLIKI